MDFILRCNSTKCRVQLVDRTVVTTCSHIFCLQCSESLGLSTAASPTRRCPACDQLLSNPDDAMIQVLNLSEEQKSTVLSGLTPGTIMECAGRAIGFYSYQAMQEILYQEYSVKHLTDRYTALKSEMNRTVQEANTEMNSLRERINSMKSEKANLEEKNRELVNAFREKSKALQNTQRMYQGLKAQVMATHTEHAAAEDAENALNNMSSPRFEQLAPPKPRGPFSQYSGDGLTSRIGTARRMSPLPNMLHTHHQRSVL
ncbi:hypothetical protein P152DRAFT_499671 [Eremomyces bilateralis CBS 781.70]|uniref:RING-type domain-containing protein n=1 Tax=Eremomyces bilateralis CBS 781.70 TaxID=1392243 RepID=A0A6G1G7V7_9PEZI|nr:uncharacterized protein P152DRAFT_499671 [Eremomyces bilateralis CBS 781.70]KAF1814114.1 hypothetical protein P152DRAFT_499671 [Eremomyces bilateralis CBS 781.70]